MCCDPSRSSSAYEEPGRKKFEKRNSCRLACKSDDAEPQLYTNRIISSRFSGVSIEHHPGQTGRRLHRPCGEKGRQSHCDQAGRFNNVSLHPGEEESEDTQAEAAATRLV